MEHFAIAAPRCRAVRIISLRPAHAREPIGVGVLQFCCGLTVLLFYFPNVSGHRRRLVRRTVERLVRIFFHAGLCQFEMVRGVCAGCWWGDRSRLELFVIATPRCRADRIISRRPRYAREPFGVGVLLFCCVLTGLLFYYSNVSDEAEAACRR